jgi:hypothetical protein
LCPNGKVVISGHGRKISKRYAEVEENLADSFTFACQDAAELQQSNQALAHSNVQDTENDLQNNLSRVADILTDVLGGRGMLILWPWGGPPSEGGNTDEEATDEEPEAEAESCCLGTPAS